MNEKGGSLVFLAVLLLQTFLLTGCTISSDRAIDLARAQAPDSRVVQPVTQIIPTNIPGMPAGYYVTLKSPEGVKKDFFVSPDGKTVINITKQTELSRKCNEVKTVAETTNRAALAQAARAQAAQISSIDLSALREEQYTLRENGERDTRVIELLGKPRYPAGIQARNANAILWVSDLRPALASRDVLVAMQEQPSQGRSDMSCMMISAPAAKEQYFLVDKNYVVYPPGVTDVLNLGPFLKLTVYVTRGGVAVPGACVKLHRGGEDKQTTSDEKGQASFYLDKTGNEDLAVMVSHQGSKAGWKSPLHTYLRGARPGVVAYALSADLSM